jgi:hypothetical protein
MCHDGTDPNEGHQTREGAVGVDTHWIPDSKRDLKPSLSPPAFISSKPPPKLDKLESVSSLRICARYLRHIAHEICTEIRCQNGTFGMDSGERSRKIA